MTIYPQSRWDTLHQNRVHIWRDRVCMPHPVSRVQVCYGELTVMLLTFVIHAIQIMEKLASPWYWAHKGRRLDAIYHEDVIKWKYFPRNWSFVRGVHRSPVTSPNKGQWRGALMFSLICAWKSGLETPWDGLRRHRAHYDVRVMSAMYRIGTSRSSIQEGSSYNRMSVMTTQITFQILHTHALKQNCARCRKWLYSPIQNESNWHQWDYYCWFI